MDNLQMYQEEYYDILEMLVRRLINTNESNSISEMAILQIGILSDSGIEFAENYLEYSDDERLRDLSLETISFLESILDGLTRIYNRCSLVTDSNNDVLVYNRAYNYIVDMFVSEMINIESDDIDGSYREAMIYYHQAVVRLARNALRFRLCRELNDILREMIMFHFRMLESYQSLSVN